MLKDYFRRTALEFTLKHNSATNTAQQILRARDCTIKRVKFHKLQASKSRTLRLPWWVPLTFLEFNQDNAQSVLARLPSRRVMTRQCLTHPFAKKTHAGGLIDELLTCRSTEEQRNSISHTRTRLTTVTN